jgi:hypothetical protein
VVVFGGQHRRVGVGEVEQVTITGDEKVRAGGARSAIR